MQGQAYTELYGFSHTLGSGSEGTVAYQISNDGIVWYWWNGSIWSPVSSSADANNAAGVNDNLAQFVDDVGTGVFFFRAFLLSDGSQTVEIEAVEVRYR